MIHEIKGHQYRIAYLDTNALSYFVKYDEFAVELLKKYTLNNYVFATNVFNILELYKTEQDFHLKIAKRLDNYPFLVLNDYVNIVNIENESKVEVPNLVNFAVGIKPLFNVNFSDLKIFIEKSKSQMNLRERIVNKEIEDWNNKKINSNPQWQKQYNKNMREAMNKLVESFGLNFKVKEFGKYKSLECMAFIKNKFCNEKPSNIIRSNSIFDMYNVAVFPYVDVYITERTVGNWLRELSNKSSFQCSNVLLISELCNPK